MFPLRKKEEKEKEEDEIDRILSQEEIMKDEGRKGVSLLSAFTPPVQVPQLLLHDILMYSVD